MKQMTARYWLNYIKVNTNANKTAARQMERYIATYGTDDMDRLATFAYGLVSKYGEASAALSCEVYESTARAQGVSIPDAEPAETASFEEVSKAVRGAAKRSPQMIPDTVGRLVKQAGADTTLKNALRDGAYFAWVPHGDTCAFCCMLAGNDWQKASKKTIKGDHAEHIHANCDCEFAVSFNGPGKIEGYDPGKYRAMYDNAEGNNWQEKLNSLRRQQYAANPEKYRRQKREAYAKRKADDIPLGKSLEGYTRGQKRKIQRLFKQSPQDIQKVFTKYGNKFDAIDEKNVDLNKGRAYFNTQTGRVHMFRKDTINGSPYKAPFQTHVHEFAHNLDYLAGNSKDFFSLSWRNKNGKTLEDIIENDWDKAVKDFFFSDTKHGYMQFLESQFGSGGQGEKTFLRGMLENWKRINSIDEQDSEYLKLKKEIKDLDGSEASCSKFWERHFDTFKDMSYTNNRKEVLDAFIKELNDSLSEREKSDISDMFQRYAMEKGGPAYWESLGCYHEEWYALAPGNLTIEAFAEMTAATITNPDSLEQIKKYLPNAYNAYLEMLRSMI